MPSNKPASGKLGKKPASPMVSSLKKMKKTPGDFLKGNLKTLIKKSKTKK